MENLYEMRVSEIIFLDMDRPQIVMQYVREVSGLPTAESIQKKNFVPLWEYL
jgi:hypothetical protein